MKLYNENLDSTIYNREMSGSLCPPLALNVGPPLDRETMKIALRHYPLSHTSFLSSRGNEN
jgi:hypothetical protein